MGIIQMKRRDSYVYRVRNNVRLVSKRRIIVQNANMRGTYLL